MVSQLGGVQFIVKKQISQSHKLGKIELTEYNQFVVITCKNQLKWTGM